ncbi:MAG: hypothetical protein D6694_11450 [Gammaproteobacteria bacterium]|nr:MAG: hypothetical protein D6694_11450 [Gammaproteobacteria bacterium]
MTPKKYIFLALFATLSLAAVAKVIYKGPKPPNSTGDEGYRPGTDGLTADFLDTWDYNKEIAKYADKLIPPNYGPMRSDDSTMVPRPNINPPPNNGTGGPKVCEKDPRLPPDCRCPYYDASKDIFIMCP